MQDRGNEVISLKEAAARATKMAADAYARHTKRVALAKANHTATQDEIIAALDELNAGLEAANLYLRKIRSRPEHAFHMSSLMLIGKGFDDGEIDDDRRSTFIKVLKPKLQVKTDPIAALNAGLMIDLFHN